MYLDLFESLGVIMNILIFMVTAVYITEFIPHATSARDFI